MKKKCVFVIGPESSGSMLIARIISHVLNIHSYGKWGGGGWSDKGQHKVCHRSLPFGREINYPNISEWIAENEHDYQIYFVLTTRDITLAETSKMARFSKSQKQAQQESEHAREILTDVIQSKNPSFIWSYETFMFLGKTYLDLLYDFLDITSDFIPELADGNKKRINTGSNRQTPASS